MCEGEIGEVSSTTTYVGGAKQEFQKQAVCWLGQSLSSSKGAAYGHMLAGNWRTSGTTSNLGGTRLRVPASMPYVGVITIYLVAMQTSFPGVYLGAA